MFGVNKFETYVFASGSGVAQIGNTTYASLQEAFDAVPEDEMCIRDSLNTS